MSNYFSLNDGNILSAGVFGLSLSSYDTLNVNTNSIVPVLSSGIVSAPFLNNGSTLSAIVLQPADGVNSNNNLYLQLDSTVNNGYTFVDSSTANFTINNVNTNSVYRSDISPFRPEGWQIEMYGTNGDWLTVPKINFSNQPFTIEFWVFPTSPITAGTNFFGQDNGAGSVPKLIFYSQTGNNSLTLGLVESSTVNQYISTVSVSANTLIRTYEWTHLAVVREGSGVNQTKVYVNGVSVASGTFTGNLSGITQPLNIGYIGEAYGTKFNGSVSNFRVLTGTALYTSNFTPSSTQLDDVNNTAALLLNGNGFKDFSKNNSTVTVSGAPFIKYGSYFTPTVSYDPSLHGESVFFDGTNSLYILDTANTGQLSFGTGDFTVEFWWYPLTKTANFAILGSADSQSNYSNFAGAWNINTTGTGLILSYSQNGGGSGVSLATIIPTVNIYQWYHVALSRNGSSIYAYVNGVLTSTVSTGFNTFNCDGRFGIGRIDTRGFYQWMHLSNLRIVKGTGLYNNANFTPSTSPLSAVNGTVLLFNNKNLSFNGSLNATTNETYSLSGFSKYNTNNNVLQNNSLNSQILKLSNPYLLNNNCNSFITLSTPNSNDITLFGNYVGVDSSKTCVLNNTNIALTSYSLFSNQNELYFNGSNSLIQASNANLALLNNDFTIEAFIYPTSIASIRMIYSSRSGVDNSVNKNYFGLYLATDGKIKLWQNNSNWFAGNRVLSINNWYHIALCRKNSQNFLFINGVLDQAGYDPGYYYFSSKFGIGSNHTTSSENFAGIISNLRVTNGRCRYSTNFTVPSSSPLLPDANTVLLLKTGVDLSKSLVSPLTAAPIITTSDSLLIGGAIKGSSTEIRTITADTFTVPNLFILNKGILTYPNNSSKTITLIGLSGLIITSDGTVNIGTSSLPISSNITHTLTLSNNNYLYVGNGGNLNVYGSYKLPYTYLSFDTSSGIRTFTTTDSVSTSWLSGDSLLFNPSSGSITTYDKLTLSSFNASNILTTTTNTVYTHNSLSSVAVPTVLNLSRNVQIRGATSTIRGGVVVHDAAKAYFNNVEFTNIGFAVSGKRGLTFNTNLSGNVVLSGSVININPAGANISGLWIVNNKPYAHNLTIDNNIIYGAIATQESVLFESVSADNLIFTNNINTSGGGSTASLLFSGITGRNLSSNNNYVIGSNTNGTQFDVRGPSKLSGSFGVTNYNSLSQGLVINGNSSNTLPTFNNIKSLYNTKEGVYINAIGVGSNTYSMTFNGLSAIGNSATGFVLYGNNRNYLTPFNLNVNNYYAFKNGGYAFNSFNITGILSNWNCNSNIGFNTAFQLGNGKTIISNISSINNNYNTINTTTVGSPTYLSALSSNPFNSSLFGSNYYTAGNYHVINTSPSLGFDTSDFTIECWVYPIGTSGYPTIFTLGNFAGDNGYYGVILRTSSDGFYWNGSNVGNWSSTLGANTWSHVAVVRYNGVVNIYVNGISTLTTSTVSNLGTSRDLYIGASKHTSGSEPFNGYISNFRVSKVAVYTSNFDTSVPILPRTPLGFSNGTQFLITKNISSISLPPDFVFNGINYNETIINNISSYSNSNYGIHFDNTKYESFVLENSNLSNKTLPLNMSPVLEGSYRFHNNTFEVSSISASILSNYQSDGYTESGFAFMKHNNITENHFKITNAGKISLDKTVFNGINTVSEKLEPYSSTTKLKSIKLIPINKGDQYTVSVTFKKSSNYTGVAPRLMLKHNGSLGYNQDTILATSILGNNVWETITGSLPSPALDNGIVEIYVDCSGNLGSGYINIDSWELI